MAKDLNNSRNVINDHHQHNCFPRPPDPSILRDIRLQQPRSNVREQHCGRTNGGIPRPSTTDSQAPPVPPETSLPQVQPVPPEASLPQVQPILPQAQTMDAPPGPLEGSTTKLHAYPHSFRAVIERAKLIAQCNAASVDPFVTRPQFLNHRSNEFFNEAVAEAQNMLSGA